MNNNILINEIGQINRESFHDIFYELINFIHFMAQIKIDSE